MRLLCTLAVAALVLGCVDPKDRRPGLRLSGEVVAAPVDDWSFSDEHPEIFIETRTRYLLPHSVTIVCASLDGRLFVGARQPEQKRWVAHVLRDPDVRLKIGSRVYERRLVRVDDPAEQEIVYRAYVRKYGWELAPPHARPPVWYFRVSPRS